MLVKKVSNRLYTKYASDPITSIIIFITIVRKFYINYVINCYREVTVCEINGTISSCWKSTFKEWICGWEEMLKVWTKKKNYPLPVILFPMLLKAGPKLLFLPEIVVVIGGGNFGNPCLFARPQGLFCIPWVNALSWANIPIVQLFQCRAGKPKIPFPPSAGGTFSSRFSWAIFPCRQPFYVEKNKLLSLNFI